MRTVLLTLATVAMLGCQMAPALAQATADERQDRSRSGRDDSGVRRDTAEIRELNAKVRAVNIRMKHDHGDALAADRKELAGLEEQERSTRANEASLNSDNRTTQKDYHQDETQQHPH